MRCLPLIAVAALLSCGWTGCERRPDMPKTPEVVYVTVKELVDVPDELTLDCIVVQKRNNSLSEAVRLANARQESVDECTGRMRQIRNLRKRQ